MWLRGASAGGNSAIAVAIAALNSSFRLQVLAHVPGTRTHGAAVLGFSAWGDAAELRRPPGASKSRSDRAGDSDGDDESASTVPSAFGVGGRCGVAILSFSPRRATGEPFSGEVVEELVSSVGFFLEELVSSAGRNC